MCRAFFIPFRRMTPVSLYIVVIHLYQSTVAKFCLTLNERVTLSAPGYLFTFHQRVGAAEILLELSPIISNERYQQFELIVDNVFAGYRTGQWSYLVKEFEEPAPEQLEGMSRIECLKAIAGRTLETGLMQLHKDTRPDNVFYESQTNFIQPQ